MTGKSGIWFAFLLLFIKSTAQLPFEALLYFRLSHKRHCTDKVDENKHDSDCRHYVGHSVGNLAKVYMISEF